MSQLKNMSIVLVIVFGAMILQSTKAVDHIVGGSTGWTASIQDAASFYSNWASNITFRQNDVLVFNFGAEAHTVGEVNKANFDNCNLNQNIQLLTTPPARVTLNKTGVFYFICTVQGHCANGQKLSVNVIASSPTPPSTGIAPTSPTNGEVTPPSSPTEPGATPPSPGSATTLIANFAVLIAVVNVINLLF